MAIGSSKGLAGDASLQTSRLIGYLVLAVFLMALDHRAQYLSRFHGVVDEFVQPVYLLIDLPLDWASRGGRWFEDTKKLIEDNNRLTEQLNRQQAELQLLESLQQENADLRALLGLSKARRLGAITARVRRVDLNPFSHRLVIDRGRVDGIQASQAVVDRDGLIGQIDQVSATSSQVILITDPDHALPVRVARTGLVTLAYGGGLKTDLSLPDLPMNVDLVSGDALITSGLGGVFPAGLPVATITDISRPEGESFAVAEATPQGAPDRARFVLVLTPAPSETPALESPAPERAAPASERDPADG